MSNDEWRQAKTGVWPDRSSSLAYQERKSVDSDRFVVLTVHSSSSARQLFNMRAIDGSSPFSTFSTSVALGQLPD